MAHALILGASGISGWSLLNQARKYPTSTTFSRITGTTNRPLTLEKARIPADERIRLVAGVDFTKSVDEVVSTLKNKIPDVDTVTHVFFTGKRIILYNFLLEDYIVDLLTRFVPNYSIHCDGRFRVVEESQHGSPGSCRSRNREGLT
jgi:hypothetical protein